jgi:hypothetical protein
MDAGQYNLGASSFNKTFEFPKYILRDCAARTASCERNNTIGTSVVAAILDLQKTPRSRVQRIQQTLGSGQPAWFVCGSRRRDVIGYQGLITVPDHQSNSRDLFDLFGAHFSVAASYHDFGSIPAPDSRTNHVPALRVALDGHRAGVDDIDVSFSIERHDGIAFGEDILAEEIGLVLVDFTPER